MFLSSIHLRQYRSYTDAVFEFTPSVTMVTGANGAGKTNLLEAVYVLLTGSSFRDGDSDLLQHGATWWTLDGVVDGIEREVRYDGAKSYRIGETWYKRLPKQFTMPVVLFEPDDLQLIHGSPRARRKYLDEWIMQTDRQYKSLIARYERIVAQRNKLLKSPRYDEDQLFIWDMQLAETATIIMQARRQVIDIWNNHLAEYYSAIAQTDTDITIQYHSKTPAENYYQHIIQQLHYYHERDRLIGSTSVGPHRDDYEFFIGGSSFITNASRGEVRSLLLSLKQLQRTQLEIIYHTAPLLLMDDVLSELDESRQKQLMAINDGQRILTSTRYRGGRATKVVRIES